MTSTSTRSDNKENFFVTVRNFPPIINGRINMIEFIDASTDLVTIIERLGTIYAPIKYDMQRNIYGMKTLFTYDKNSCLLELMLAESDPERPGADSVLWLSRGILFFDIAFTQLMSYIKTNNTDVNMKQIFTVAYEGSVKKYHNWAIQEIFNFICKVSPTMPQVYKALEVDDRIEEFQAKFLSFYTSLHLVRCKIDEFFKDNKFFDDPL